MKIMIPASGGLDSTVMLWETLTETAHDVVAVRFPRDFGLTPDAQAKQDRELSGYRAVCAWLQDHARAFRAVEVPSISTAPDGIPFDRAEQLPIRPGFTATLPVHWMRCFYASIGAAADALAPDQVWLSLTTWNLRRGGNWPGATGIATPPDYAARTTIPLLTPWVVRSPQGVRSGRGRFGLARRLPAALRERITRCGEANAPCGTCRTCLGWDFCRLVCADLPAEDLIRVEERLELVGCYGRFAHLADPQTYSMRALYDHMADTDEWRQWIADQTR